MERLGLKMSNKNDHIRYVLFIFDEMRAIISRLITIRNNGVKSKEMEKLDKENDGVIQKRKKLLEARDWGIDLEGVFDYVMNENETDQFKWVFKVNNYPPFSLAQILDFNFYPDAENYPRTVHESRTIK